MFIPDQYRASALKPAANATNYSAHYRRNPSQFQKLGAYPMSLIGCCVLSAADFAG
jgi:hypothetical protein